MKGKIILIALLFVSTFAYAGNREKPVKQIQYTVTVTNSVTEIISENLAGQDIFIQNNDASGIVYLNFSGDATVSATMIRLAPGENLDAPNMTNAVTAIGSIVSNANVAISLGK